MVDFTKPLQTRNGLKVEIVTTEGRRDTYPVLGYIDDEVSLSCWTKAGKFNHAASGEHHLDLVNVGNATHVRYLNFYANGSYGLHKHIESAKSIASGASTTNPCVARVRVEIKEGQFDE